MTMRIIKEAMIIALIDIVFLSIYSFSPFSRILRLSMCISTFGVSKPSIEKKARFHSFVYILVIDCVKNMSLLYIILYNKSHKVIVEICRKVGEIVEKSLSYKLPEREKEAMKGVKRRLE